MVFIGVDPGKDGAIALLDGERARALLCPAPVDDARNLIDPGPVLEFLAGAEVTAACVEEVGAMPGNGGCSMFSFGLNCGAWDMLCRMQGWSVSYVRPRAWMREILSEETRGDGKDKPSVGYVRRQYPELDLAPGRRRVPQDGITDAVCIAEYARAKWEGWA